jgi:hypothetical protein
MRGVPEGQLDERCQSDNNARSMEEREAVLAKLEEHRADLSRLGVKSLALFGSAARGEARADSDIDLLVDFAHPVGLFAFLELKGYLERLLARPVDLVTANALRPDFREAILREAIHAR